MAALDFTETRFVPAFRELIADPAVVEEFDRLATFLRAALAGTAQRVVEVALEDGPPLFFDPLANGGLGAMTTTQPDAAIAASDGVTPIPNDISYHSYYTNQIINRYHTVFKYGGSDDDGEIITGVGDLKLATVNLTNGQIKSLNTSPVDIGPTGVIPIEMVIQVKKPDIAYSANSAWSIGYSTGLPDLVTSITVFLMTTADFHGHSLGANYDLTGGSVPIGRQLQIRANADVTGGDGANSARVTMVYYEIPSLF